MRGPTLQLDDILIVVEGTARLTWCRTDPMRWRPTSLWPTPEQEAEVAARLDRGSPLLVVLADVPAAVPLLAEELTGAPAALAELAEFTGQVGELRVPFLNWLPPELRDRGRRFLDLSEKRRKHLPRALRPPLFVEPDGEPAIQVRFAHWLRPGHPSLDELAAVARYVFSNETNGSGDR